MRLFYFVYTYSIDLSSFMKYLYYIHYLKLKGTLHEINANIKRFDEF